VGDYSPHDVVYPTLVGQTLEAIGGGAPFGQGDVSQGTDDGGGWVTASRMARFSSSSWGCA
jgi:hypothetical protein